MSRASNWQFSAPALCLVLAGLASCAQSPVAPQDSVTRAVVADAGKPKPLINTGSCARPEYPKASQRRGSQGTTTIRFLIDTDGSVAQSEITGSTGDALLDEAARSALLKCRFKPAIKDGQPQRAWVPVQYVWSLQPASKPAARAAQP